MTDEQVLTLLGGDSPFNMARQEFSAACGHIAQACCQSTGISTLMIRQMEFEAVRRLAEILGVTILPNGATSHLVPWHG